MIPVAVLGWQVHALVGLFGALVGSFLNVCIVRIPSSESIVLPASHCRACKGELRWFDNVPIISYLALRGRCRMCKAPFSARYMIVEVTYTVDIEFIGGYVYQWHFEPRYEGPLIF